MFSHLNSMKHKQNFSTEVLTSDADKVLRMDTKYLNDFIKPFAENNQNLFKKIKTRKTDKVKYLIVE